MEDKHYLGGLKIIREARAMTQTDLSKLSGINRTTIWKYETGKSQARMSSVNKLAHALKCKPRYLYGVKTINLERKTLRIITTREIIAIIVILLLTALVIQFLPMLYS